MNDGHLHPSMQDETAQLIYDLVTPTEERLEEPLLVKQVH
jgi:hypothetical protein